VEKIELKNKLRALLEEYQNYSEEVREKMSEDDTRAKFIDPLLKEVLGWNEREIDRQTSIESLNPEGHMKRADYSYPKVPKIIVEAKKLKVPIDDGDFDNQVIDYAYSKAVNWAILTNFKSFRAWYVTRKGKNTFCRLNLIKDNIDQIVDELFYFINDNVFNGSLDKAAEVRGIKLQEINITGDLTESLNTLRQKLNNYLKKEYEAKYPEEIDREELTQGIINRLIFIKKIEAENLEENKLEQLIRKRQETVYEKLSEIFTYYRLKYDSDVFGLPDVKAEVEKLKIVDHFTLELLKVISSPLDSDRAYNFATIDVDVLGSVYENYLAYMQKGIKLVGGRTKRKEQGIYYTPKYVVKYIVDNTLGNSLTKLSLSKTKDLKILDMACGSGSFLIGALKELDRYYSRDVKNYADFSIKSKLNLIKNNLYGVDLDEKAITIAELNIYLSLFSLAKKQKAIATHESLLPELKNNIKIGNSLIDDNSIGEDKGFIWEEEFSSVSKAKFDVIIGNPPYLNIKLLTKNNLPEKSFYEKRYASASGNYDIYVIFIQKAIELLKEGGRLGFIVPNKFAVTDYGLEVRKFILDNCQIEKIIDVSNLKVFSGVGVYPIILILKKQKNTTERNANKVKTAVINYETELIENLKYIEIEQKTYLENKDNIFVFGKHIEQLELINRLREGALPLNKVAVVNSGTTGFEYTNWGKHITDTHQSGSIPFVITGNIEEYIINREKVVRYQGRKLIKAFFKKGGDVTEGKWKLFSTPKILIRGMALKLTAAYDEIGSACGVSVYTITKPSDDVELFYLLALLNSKLIDYFYKSQFISKHLAGKYIGYNKGQIEQIPVRVCSKVMQNEIVRLVEKRIELSNELAKINIEGGRKESQLKEKINSIDERINDLIYKIYDVFDVKELIEKAE
jgi:type I restriction-modification system DNA methylase subunit